MHGGRAGRPIETGRYSLIHKRRLQDKVAQYMADPQPTDLLSELALTRALLEDLLGRLPDPISQEATSHVAGLVGRIGQLAHRMERIKSMSAFGPGELAYVVARLADVLLQKVADPAVCARVMDELARDFRLEVDDGQN